MSHEAARPLRTGLITATPFTVILYLILGISSDFTVGAVVGALVGGALYGAVIALLVKRRGMLRRGR